MRGQSLSSVKCAKLQMIKSKIIGKSLKKNIKKNWKEKFSEFEVGVILCTDYEQRDLLFEEAFAIAVLKPRYNF